MSETQGEGEGQGAVECPWHCQSQYRYQCQCDGQGQSQRDGAVLGPQRDEVQEESRPHRRARGSGRHPENEAPALKKLSLCLRKKETVSGIIGKIQGVRSAIRPPIKPSKNKLCKWLTPF